MSNENITNMVDSLTSGDNVAAQAAFKGALTDKIGDALDNKRQSVANDWLNAGDDFEAVQSASGLDDLGVAPEGTVDLTGQPNDDVDFSGSEPTEPFEIDDEPSEEE